MSIPTKYPFAALKHGESFVVACADGERFEVRRRLSVTAAAVWHAHPRNFCRFTVTNADDGLRVTRVA